MSNIEKYINEILVNVKPLTVENVVNYCKESLKKYYSERKLHQLEIVRDYIIENYINTSGISIETNEQLPF